MSLTAEDIEIIGKMMDSKLDPIRTDIGNIKKVMSDFEKRLSFIEITVDSTEKKIDKLMKWTLADKDGIDYSAKA
jgi:hypothetical protein